MIAQPAILTQTAGPPPPPPAQAAARSLRGAEVSVEALVHEGVDSIFGYPGGAVLHIYDELWRVRDRSARACAR